MIFANNNKKIIKSLSKKSMKKNNMRNLFAIIAIVLVCLLFTTLFTIGFSLVESMETQIMRMVGTSAHGGLKYITYEEYEKVKEHPLVADIGLRIVISTANNEAFNKRANTQIQYNDKKSAKWGFLYPTTGKMPEEYNEIVVDSKTLDALGLPHEVGQVIMIEYEINGEPYSTEFLIVGFFETDEAAAYDVGYVLVSKTFADQTLEGIDYGELRKIPLYTGAHFADIMLRNDYEIEEKIYTILIDTVGESPYVKPSVNWGYMSTNFSDVDLETIIMMLVLIGTILLCGYLIINNIFRISIVNDIRYYGLLKAVGTTSKQIMMLVRSQMIRLCIYGVPIGVALGYLTGVVIFPTVIETFTISVGTVSYNPLIVVFSSLFTILTVYLSSLKPCKIAGKVSAIEAVRYNANASIRRRKNKSRSSRIYKMAWRNIFRNRAKTFSIIASIVLSLMVLMIVSALIGGFDAEEFVSFMSPMDFSVGANQYFSVQMFSDFKPLDQQMVDDINEEFDIPVSEYIYFTQYLAELNAEQEVDFKEWVERDIEEGRIVKDDLRNLDYYFKNDLLSTMIYGVDDLAMQTLNVVHGEMTLDMWHSGEYVIGNAFLHEVGDTIVVKGDNGSKEYIVGGTIYTDSRLIDSLGIGYASWYTVCFYVPSDDFVSLFEVAPLKYAFNVPDEDMVAINDYLEHYTNTINNEMNYASKLKYIQEFEEYIMMFKTVGYLLSAIVGFIGVCNFINSMLTSIVIRKREFACMESVGMVKGQLYRLLMFEGFYYSIIAIFVTLIIGQPVIYYAMKIFGSKIWFFDFSNSYGQILGIIPFLLIVTSLLPIAAYKGYDKLSLVERLRIGA